MAPFVLDGCGWRLETLRLWRCGLAKFGRTTWSRWGPWILHRNRRVRIRVLPGGLIRRFLNWQSNGLTSAVDWFSGTLRSDRTARAWAWSSSYGEAQPSVGAYSRVQSGADAGMAWKAVGGWLAGVDGCHGVGVSNPTVGDIARLRNLCNFDDSGVSDAVAARVPAELAGRSGWRCRGSFRTGFSRGTTRSRGFGGSTRWRRRSTRRSPTCRPCRGAG